MKIGIAVLAYSRNNTFKKVIESITKEKIKEISVYIDGPQNKSIEKIQANIFKTIRNFQKRIKINLIKQSKNNGLAFSVTNAVSSELKSNDAVILLEDDCVPQKGFFDYMKNSLIKYKKNKDVRSVCSYCNLDQINKNQAYFLKRFNPWGWATWKDRWKDYKSDIRLEINELYNLGKIQNLPLDLKTYCRNKGILRGTEDIWSLSWTLLHYKSDSLILYPPRSLIKNIGFDGTGVHCLKTNVFQIKRKIQSGKIDLPKNANLNFSNEINYNNFLIENSSKTFFKENKLDIVEPYSFIKKNKYVTYDKLNYFIEKFTHSTNVIDIHTHLFPSKFKKYYKIGIIELLNYHYLVAEFLSLTNFNPKKFYKLNNFAKANLIWNILFLKQPPVSTATLGVVKVLQSYGIKNMLLPFNKIYKILQNIKVTENDIFQLSGVKNVVMTNNPFDFNEFEILKDNKDLKYKPSIRIDDLFDKKINLEKIYNYHKVNFKDKDKYIFKLCEALIKKYLPAYFALSTENFEEFNYDDDFAQILSALEKYKIPLMLLVGVKRNVNIDYKLAGDGIGKLEIQKLEVILNKYKRNKFLVTCLDYSDQFKLTVIARKFQNIKIFGFWWFNNQKGIVKNLLSMRMDLLGDNFIIQHSDARVIDQLIYKWNDFRHIYTKVLSGKFHELIEAGYKIRTEDIEKYIYKQFSEKPKNFIKL